MQSFREKQRFYGAIWIKNLRFWLTEPEELAVTNKIPEPQRWHLCFAGRVVTGQLELKNQLWLRRDQHHWGDVFWEAFKQAQHTEAVFWKWSKSYLLLAAWLGSLRSHRGGAGFEGIARSRLRHGSRVAGLESPKRAHERLLEKVAAWLQEGNPVFWRLRYLGVPAQNSSRDGEVPAWA